MTFTGYVQFRRGLLEHLYDGRLTILEFSVLIVLISLASKETGSGTINANTLGSFMGDGLDYESEVPRNRQRGKQRILKNLEAKGYIFRLIVPHSKRAYRYWVNKYLCTDGANKSRRLDLSNVRVSQDVKDIRYVSAVAETVAEGVAETVASNKKGKGEMKQKPLSPGRASLSDSVNASKEVITDSTQSVAQKGEPCALQGVHHDMRHGALHENASSVCVTDVRHVSDTPRRIRIVPGADPYAKDADTGQRLEWAEAKQLLDSGAGIEVNQ